MALTLGLIVDGWARAEPLVRLGQTLGGGPQSEKETQASVSREGSPMPDMGRMRLLGGVMQ